MANINLLPWREERRKRRQRQFIIGLLSSAVLSGVVVLYVHVFINGMIADQNARNTFLEQQITRLDKRIKEIQELEREKVRLLARMRIIQELQANRPVVVHLFEELVKTLPDGAYLTGTDRKAAIVTVKGVAESNARVSTLMRNLDTSQWMATPLLNVIESGAKERAREYRFTLQAAQKRVIPGGQEGAQ